MRILIVDDTADSLDVLSAMAKSFGHEVIQASGGMEGVKKAIEKRPDLVLMDLRMPQIDGAQAAAALRNISSFVHVPIIMITAYPDKILEKPERVWDGVVRKPVTPEQLLEVLNRFSQ